MAEEESQEEDQSARLKHSLLVRLKTTVEGLLANNTNNVWSTYGGLGRLCKDVDQILHHRLKFVAGDYGSVNDYWPFVKGLKWLKPEITPFIEKIRKGHYQKGTSKGQVWVRESLREHNLTLQLKVLVSSEHHLHRHFFEDAFLFNTKYFTAMCLCLQAVEENQVSLLADLDPKLLNYRPPAIKVMPSHVLRSSSLPLSTATTAPSIHVPRTHRSSYGDAMALAPPFASPSQDSSSLCTSDEHVMPGNIASSASPDESRMTAREALRDVLRKSGSDSPPDLPPLGDYRRGNDLFSLYDDNVNSDPLLNLGFLQGAKSPRDSVVEKKHTLTRSASEAQVVKRPFDRRASEMMDKILVEDGDSAVFAAESVNVKSKPVSSDSKEKIVAKPSRVIFSDSEGVDNEGKHKASRGKYGKHSHKRSRSDISGIKMTVTKDGGDEILSKSQTLREPLTGTGKGLDQVDHSNGGFFPQPTEGQSLLNYLSSQDFHTCANLDKENAHFSICEALIAAVEQMKWNHVISPGLGTNGGGGEEEEEESDEEIKQLQQRIRIRKRQRLKEKARAFPVLSDGRTDTTSSHSPADSSCSSTYDSDYSDSETDSGADDKQIELTMDDSNMSRLKSSGLSLSMASLYSAFFHQWGSGRAENLDITAGLMQRLDMISLIGKKGRDVAAILTPEMKRALDILMLNLEHGELEWLSNHLGHTIDVHKEFYRNQEGAVQLGKVAKMLIAVDQGRILDNQTDENADGDVSNQNPDEQWLVLDDSSSDDEDDDVSGEASAKKSSESNASLDDADIQKKSASVEREMAFQDSIMVGGTPIFSAESVAISLLRKFSEKQLPKASDLQWLVTEQDAPQRLLPLPNSYPISPDDADKSTLTGGRMRLRGNLEWAPPRAQIIFNIHPAPQRSVLLTRQNYKCAGCGMKVETGYAKRYRYCEYLGKYFCKCCHSNHSTYIPARILQRWDFTKYPVSNFAKENILSKIVEEPLFNVADINPMLYKKVKLLDNVRDWRLQLGHLRNLLNLCKQATNLSSELSKLPQHWTADVHVYSINDLLSVKSGVGGHMYASLRNAVAESIGHVESCQFCQCFGFICEMCRDQSDIIFPYMLQKVVICQGCKTCFHKNCFVPQKCPKCARIDARKKRLEDESLEEEDREEEVQGQGEQQGNGQETTNGS